MPSRVTIGGRGSFSFFDSIVSNRYLAWLWMRFPCRKNIPFILTFTWIVNCNIYDIIAAVYILMPNGGSGISVTFSMICVWICTAILLYSYLKIGFKHPGPISQEWKQWDGKSLPKPKPPKHAIITKKNISSSTKTNNDTKIKIMRDDSHHHNDDETEELLQHNHNHTQECKDDRECCKHNNSNDHSHKQKSKQKTVSGLPVFDLPPEFMQLMDSNRGFVMMVDSGTSLQDVAQQMRKDSQKRAQAQLQAHAHSHSHSHSHSHFHEPQRIGKVERIGGNLQFHPIAHFGPDKKENKENKNDEDNNNNGNVGNVVNLVNKDITLRNFDNSGVKYEFRTLEYPSTTDVDLSIEENGGKNSSLGRDIASGRFCLPCGHFKPPRAHHCSKCKTCVDRMDHHCVWLKACIGFGNHKYFIHFLIYYILLSFVQLCMFT